MRTALKVCSRCKVERDISEFSRDAQKHDGLRSSCKVCKRETAKEYAARNPDANRARARAWYYANRERGKARTALRRIQKPEAVNSAIERWHAMNPESRRLSGIRREAQKLKATPAWANQEAIRGFYRSAKALGMLVGEWYHVDHIVPLRSKYVCGLHCEANLRVIPARENLVKLNRYWPDMPEELPCL